MSQGVFVAGGSAGSSLDVWRDCALRHVQVEKRKYSPLQANKSPLAGLAKMRAHIRQS